MYAACRSLGFVGAVTDDDAVDVGVVGADTAVASTLGVAAGGDAAFALALVLHFALDLPLPLPSGWMSWESQYSWESKSLSDIWDDGRSRRSAFE